MCGISGSNNKETAFKLYQSNLDRGFYSSGSFVIDDLNWSCSKVLGRFDTPEDKVNVPGIATEAKYYLYHSRGPTTETREFVQANNHPFFHNQWVVAHNGIISNFEKLWKKYGVGDITGKTDSSIIPRILSHKFTIGEALEELEGTFALWIYNTDSGKLYITRCGSTLFANFKTGDFSSTEFSSSTSIDEGVLYEVNISYGPYIQKLYEYKFNSPYFIL